VLNPDVQSDSSPDPLALLRKKAEAHREEQARTERLRNEEREDQERLGQAISALNEAANAMQALADRPMAQRATEEVDRTCADVTARLKAIFDMLRGSKFAENFQRIDHAGTLANYRQQDPPEGARIAYEYACTLIDRGL
jgi:hypothetical protein